MKKPFVFIMLTFATIGIIALALPKSLGINVYGLLETQQEGQFTFYHFNVGKYLSNWTYTFGEMQYVLNFPTEWEWKTGADLAYCFAHNIAIVGNIAILFLDFVIVMPFRTIAHAGAILMTLLGFNMSTDQNWLVTTLQFIIENFKIPYFNVP